MKIIVWLGNPWNTYASTRHNAGFLCVDYLQKQWEYSAWADSKFSACISEGKYGSEKVLLVKPMTYMNLSGNAVSALVQFYKLDITTDILVISDDIDMEFAKVRFRREGNHGGQNGLKDIIAKFWNNQFSRLKIGIGRDARYSVSDWVLSKFTKEELDILDTTVFPLVEEKIRNWIDV